MIYVIWVDMDDEDIKSAFIIQADEYGNYEKLIKFHEDEKGFVKFVFEELDNLNPKIVTYHHNFMALLIQKGLKYNLGAYALFEKDNMMLGKTKWENYLSRYSDHYHINLFDVINNYAGYNGSSLSELSKRLNLPILEEQNGEFNSYIVYIIYLKFEMLRGNILLSDYQHILEGLSTQIEFSEILEFITNEQS